MNDGGLLAAYVAATVQITVLSLVAAALSKFALRRSAGTAAFLLKATVILLLVLTILSFVPLPGNWFSGRWHLPRRQEPSDIERSDHIYSPDEIVSGEETPALTDASWLLAAVATWPTELSARSDVDDNRPSSWNGIVVMILLGSMVCSLLRLLVRLAAAHRLLRRSRPLTDSHLHAVFESLRDRLGCSRPVELRVSDEVRGAATMRCLRPALILASDWRRWSRTELTAVIAHELAHVRCHDYFFRLTAHVLLSLHLLHPLLWWLVRRLFLAQEAAADMTAARLVGGPKEYLVALSKMALRQDRQLGSMTVVAFSISSSFLMRRIAMLQAKDGRTSSTRRSLRVAASTILVLTATVVSAIRTPAHSDESEQTARISPTTVNQGKVFSHPRERPELDLSYIPEFGHGILVYRPQVVFGRADMQSITEGLGRMLREKLNLPDDVPIPFANIEQLTAHLFVEVHDPDGAPGKRFRIHSELGMVRTVDAYPWPTLFKALMPESTIASHGGKTTIQTPRQPLPGIGPVRAFMMLDERSMLPAASLDELLDLGRRPQQGIADKPWASDWQMVRNCVFAAVLDNSRGDWNPVDGENFDNFFPKIKHLAMGVDWKGDEASLLVLVECNSTVEAQDVSRQLAKLTEAMKRKRVAASPVSNPMPSIYAAMLSDVRLDVTDSRVRMTAKKKLDATQILALVASVLPLGVGDRLSLEFHGDLVKLVTPDDVWKRIEGRRDVAVSCWGARIEGIDPDHNFIVVLDLPKRSSGSQFQLRGIIPPKNIGPDRRVSVEDLANVRVELKPEAHGSTSRTEKESTKVR